MENEVDPPAHFGSEAIDLRWTLKDIAAKRSWMINKQHLAQLLSWVSSRSRTLPLTAISISASAQLAWRRHCIISARGRPPLWRIDIEALGRIVRQQSLLAQPLCLPAYRRALAMQPFGNLEAEFVGHKVTSSRSSSSVQRVMAGLGHGGPST
jgi:hypothetical protein